jgi:hypothetical protein
MKFRSIILKLSGVCLPAFKKSILTPLLNIATGSGKRNTNKKKHSGSRLVLWIILTIGVSSFRIGTISFHKKIKEPSSPNLILQFKATVHGQPLRLHEKYTNPFEETFELDMFRFYAGKITASYKGRLVKKIFSVSDYHLVDFADSATTSITLWLPEGDYDEIQFQLGIDSIDQISGAQTGALDPLKGMFWTWNSGYTSFKLGGISPESNEPAHTFFYHIGGYRSPNITVSIVKLAASGNLVFHVNKEGIARLDIPIELDHFFNGLTPVHIRNIPACTTPGEPAHRLFENFAGLFTEIEIPEKP